MLTPVVDQRAVASLRVGYLIPKRHARRAVTRVAVRRQMRAAVLHNAARLAGGEWVLRLRAPFAPAAFRSACSVVLAQAVRRELEGLLARALSPAASGAPLPGAAA